MRRRLMLSSGEAVIPPEEKVNCITVSYNIAQADYTEPVLSSYFDLGQVVQMLVDDVEVEVARSLKFATTGVHKVKYVFGQLTSLYRMLYNISYAYCRIVDVDMSSLDASAVTTMSGMLYGADQLTAIDMTGVDISKVTNMSYMFQYCSLLASVTMTGDPASLTAAPASMFDKVWMSGTLYYNGNHDYSKIIAALPSTWKAVAI